MRPRAGSWFPCSPQLSPEQAANHVVVSRVGTDVGERTPIVRHCNSRSTYSTPALWPVTVPPRISSTRVERAGLHIDALAFRASQPFGDFKGVSE